MRPRSPPCLTNGHTVSFMNSLMSKMSSSRLASSCSILIFSLELGVDGVDGVEGWGEWWVGAVRVRGVEWCGGAVRVRGVEWWGATGKEVQVLEAVWCGVAGRGGGP